ncbi:MAG: ABC transporter ATP-binding protein [Cyclobacteriaceae bacterium]|nr:ABC transporter ATP-binding protein [Cyclobacteriaceae bacterium]
MLPALEVKGISKKFNIRHESPYLSLRDRVMDLFKPAHTSHEDFWALRDVSFEVKPGESIGIIGKNGAGKSTLLKILSKITPPTQGSVIGRGRIASLLEVGTGFHPELTGRENIFLNGSILGMKRQEIAAKFDAIVDFAGTERFLDTPLKHYSSGMQLRLAFAVAAFLEPEILVIDEVLAVGDAEFQKKCIGKMEDVSRSGRTILFVSHNMAAVQSLCTTCLLLQRGELKAMGPSADVVTQYLTSLDSQTLDASGYVAIHSAESEKPIRAIEVLCDNQRSAVAYMGCALEIRLYFKANEFLTTPVLGIIIKDNYSTPLIGVNNRHYSGNFETPPLKEGFIAMKIPYLNLFEGTYHVDVHLGNEFKDIEVIQDCFQFTVEPLSFSGSGELPLKSLNRMFMKDITWTLNSTNHVA